MFTKALSPASIAGDPDCNVKSFVLFVNNGSTLVLFNNVTPEQIVLKSSAVLLFLKTVEY